MRNLGPVQQKVILLLLTGLALGVTRSSVKQYRIIGQTIRDWKKINKQSLERAINSLYASHLLGLSLQKDGTWKMVLTENGRKRALFYNLENMRIRKPKVWDKKWRFVAFDIPEKQKKSRDALRGWMKRVGFHKFQASIFVSPYDCKNEFDFMVEFLNLRKYVRFLVVNEVDSAIHLKKIFHLV